MGINSENRNNISTYTDGQQFDFINSQEGILHALTDSKINSSVIGIYSPSLGETMVVTGVENIVLTDSDTVIVLKKYDMSGQIFERHVLLLSEIISVCPFTSPIKNPFLENIEKNTDWFTIINSRENNG